MDPIVEVKFSSSGHSAEKPLLKWRILLGLSKEPTRHGIDLFATTAQHSLYIYLNNTCNPEISKVLIFRDLVLPKWDQSKLVCVQSEQSGYKALWNGKWSKWIQLSVLDSKAPPAIRNWEQHKDSFLFHFWSIFHIQGHEIKQKLILFLWNKILFSRLLTGKIDLKTKSLGFNLDLIFVGY